MRKIRFRGVKTVDGEWTYGSLIEKFLGVAIDTCNRFEEDGVTSLEWAFVNNESVGQFIGQTERNEKGVKGKEIYELDIVRVWGGEYHQGYWEHSEKFLVASIIDSGFMIGEFEFVEVLGNSIDNPDLLRRIESERESKQAACQSIF